MITRKDIDGAMFSGAAISTLVEQLLKERDAAEARAEAYREVAMMNWYDDSEGRPWQESDFDEGSIASIKVEAEAQRILEAKKGGI